MGLFWIFRVRKWSPPFLCLLGNHRRPLGGLFPFGKMSRHHFKAYIGADDIFPLFEGQYTSMCITMSVYWFLHDAGFVCWFFTLPWTGASVFHWRPRQFYPRGHTNDHWIEPGSTLKTGPSPFQLCRFKLRLSDWTWISFLWRGFAVASACSISPVWGALTGLIHLALGSCEVRRPRCSLRRV